MEKELEQLGLTKNQSMIYLELLKHPWQTGGEISKKINLDRSFTYGVLKNLISMGLVSFVINNSKRVYAASNPENLLKESEERLKIASKIVTELKLIKPTLDLKESVEVFEGASSLKKFSRELSKEKEFYLFGGGGELKTLEILKYQYHNYVKEAKINKVSGKILASKKNAQILKKILKNLKIKIKIIDKSPSQINTILYGETVAIYSSEKPYLINIKNKDVYNAFKSYFDIIWNR